MKLSPCVKGMLFAATGFALFTVNDTCLKLMTQKYPSGELVALPYGFAVLFLLGWLIVSKRGAWRQELVFKKFHLHALRGIAHALAILGMMAGLARLPLTDMYVIIFLMPLLTALFSALLLKEKPNMPLVAALAASFVGILIAFHSAGANNLAALACFGGTVFFALSFILMRKMVATESTSAIMVSMNAITGALLLLISLSQFIVPDMKEWALFAFVGAVNVSGYKLMTEAARLTTAPYVTAPQFLQLIYGSVAGFIVFHDVPGTRVLLGGALVIVANLYLLYVQNRKARLAS